MARRDVPTAEMVPAGAWERRAAENMRGACMPAGAQASFWGERWRAKNPVAEPWAAGEGARVAQERGYWRSWARRKS